MPSFDTSRLLIAATLAVCSALGLGGCDPRPATQLLVVADTDYRVPDEAARLRAEVRSTEGELRSAHDFALLGDGAPDREGGVHMPTSFGVAPGEQSSSDPIAIELSLLDGAGEALVTRRAVTSFVEGETRRLPMFLARSCEGVACEEGLTCARGECVDESVDPEDLERTCPGCELDGGPAGDADRPDDAGADGAGPQDGGGEDAGGDAGSLDAGPTDAGHDAGPTDAGPDAGDGGPLVPGENVNVVFVTSSGFTPGELGGLAGADAECNRLAEDAGLGGTYVAWLSDSTTDARDRLGSARGWVRPDGRPFVDTQSDLVSGATFYPPRIDEQGRDVGGGARVVTGTGSSGTGLSGYCDDWTSTTSGGCSGGYADGGPMAWSYRWGGTGACDDTGLRLYCFGTDHAREVSPPPPSGPIAFLSATKLSPGSGLGAADSLCQSEADDAGLTGEFVALVATDDASAASRLSTVGPGWWRPDGVRIAESASALLSGATPLAPIDRSASGERVVGGLVWTGASAINEVELDAASSCRGWTSSASTDEAIVGNASYSGARYFNDFTRGCDGEAGVYCVQGP